MDTEAKYYVYALFHQDEITPFYIGKGIGGRWLTHRASVVNGRRSVNAEKDAIIRRMVESGCDVPKVKIEESLSNSSAIRLEIDLILLIGRRPNGPLVNRTPGGDGTNGRSGPHTEATRAKMSAAKRGHARSPETIEKMRRAATAQALMPGATEQFLKRVAAPEARARMQQSLRDFYAVRENRERLSNQARSQYATPEGRQKASDAAKRRWASADERAKLSARKKGHIASLETRKKMSDSHRRRHAKGAV